MANRASKGSAFERAFCKELSLWWTGGERDDVFWRSSNSGGRAKVRGRAGKNTAGQHGDISATDPIGEPLTKLLTIELKRGYSKFTVADMLDKPKNAATQKWEEWYNQVTESAAQAGSFAWLLIQKRDHRDALVFMPIRLFDAISDWLSVSEKLFSRLNFLTKKPEIEQVACMKWDYWLSEIYPNDIHIILSKLGREQ